MAELTIATFLSMDGVMQAPGDPNEDTSGNFSHGGWVFPFFDADMGATMEEIFAKADAFLLGRTTYDIFSAYWPRITDANNLIAVKLNALPKYVASRTTTSFEWNQTTHVQDILQEVPALKQRYPREVQIHGSSGLAQTLIAHDLIDVYRLLIFPVVLGAGKRLFGAGAIPLAFKLENSITTGTGVIISVYRRAGDLATGTFAQD
jgi:dihydrofolate reductase